MKAKGIPFKPEMVRAFLNTKVGVWPAEAIDPKEPWKWQTRGLIKMQAKVDCIWCEGKEYEWIETGDEKSGRDYRMPCRCITNRCPHPVGSILYAKEIYYVGDFVCYQADRSNDFPTEFKWKSSIFMPMSAARIFLEVMAVRVERVNQIREADAEAEGSYWGLVITEGKIPKGQVGHRTGYGRSRKAGYKQLWDSIYGQGSFEKGPWVWVYEVQRIEKPGTI